MNTIAMHTPSASNETNSQRQQPLVLAEGIEMLSGMNDIPLLYVEQSKRYIRLSPLGAEVMRALLSQPQQSSPTMQQIERGLIERYPGREAEIADKLRAFLQQLQEADVLTTPADESGTVIPLRRPLLKRIARAFSNRPMLRYSVWQPERPLFQNLVHKVEAINGDTAKTLLGFWLMLAALIAFYVLVQLGSSLPMNQVVWPFVVAYFLLHVTVHELSHTLVSSYYGVRVREIGVALLYYILPVAYTDRTDAYRLRDPRQRIHIALAGPALDISAAAITAVLAYSTHGWLGASCHVVLFLEIITFISNLNPIMPSDGYHALEAAFGELNFRQRAFTLLWRRITFRALPAQLQRLTLRQKMLYTAYACIGFAYAGMLGLFIVRFVVSIVLGVIKP